MNTKENLLELHQLRVDVADHHVLRSVSLQVRAGELLVLMGANGSGKSTLGLALLGLVKPP
ncbi:MAG: ATP-binding cassette domain-containing protein, partial [Betaproteobacteria bacterium]